VPEGVAAHMGWRCLKVEGPLDFCTVGILADLTTALAEAGISVFALSTYDTDYLLIQTALLSDGLRALRVAGYLVDRVDYGC